MDSDARNRVLSEARAWLGTPWHHQGAIKGVGVDCARLLCEVYHNAGLTPEIDPRPYPADWHFHRDEERFLGWLTDYADEVATPEPGDVVVFKFGRCFAHGGIVTAWPLVIHSYNQVGVREQDASTGRLAGRQVKFFMVKTS